MTDSDKTTRSKVARLIQRHNLAGVGEELEERWTRSQDRWSLRELADYFNRQLLKTTLEENNADPIDGEIENLFRLLTDETVTSGSREEARNRLKNSGVDIEQLQSEFVSYQAIRTYLQNYRELESPDTTPAPTEHRSTKKDTIQRLKSRLSNVTERSLNQLKNAGHLRLGDFRVIVTVRVHCEDCGSQRPVTELLTQGGCECDS
jgi:translation initiation factor 2 beta subunit (eIF-2beta)/eIF-5